MREASSPPPLPKKGLGMDISVLTSWVEINPIFVFKKYLLQAASYIITVFLSMQ